MRPVHISMSFYLSSGRDRLRPLKYIIHLIWILEKHLSKNLRVNANRGASTGRAVIHHSPRSAVNVNRRLTRELYERLCWLTPGNSRIAASLIQVAAEIRAMPSAVKLREDYS